MGVEERTHFQIDRSKCTRCGKCMAVCSGMVIEPGTDRYPRMKEFERFGRWLAALSLLPGGNYPTILCLLYAIAIWN